MSLEGKTIGGKYRILGQVGVGGMAMVYRGEHIYLKKTRGYKGYASILFRKSRARAKVLTGGGNGIKARSSKYS
jgi:hypothetical protein